MTERTTRERMLTPEEGTNYETVRAQVEEEFPHSEHEGIDITPTLKGYEARLRIVAQQGMDRESRAWANEELMRIESMRNGPDVRKASLISKFCALAQEVAVNEFEFPKCACDCFCKPQVQGWSFDHDARIFEFIERVVHDALSEPAQRYETAGVIENGTIKFNPPA